MLVNFLQFQKKNASRLRSIYLFFNHWLIDWLHVLLIKIGESMCSNYRASAEGENNGEILDKSLNPRPFAVILNRNIFIFLW